MRPMGKTVQARVEVKEVCRIPINNPPPVHVYEERREGRRRGGRECRKGGLRG